MTTTSQRQPPDETRREWPATRARCPDALPAIGIRERATHSDENEENEAEELDEEMAAGGDGRRRREVSVSARGRAITTGKLIEIDRLWRTVQHGYTDEMKKIKRKKKTRRTRPRRPAAGSHLDKTLCHVNRPFQCNG